LKIREAAFGPRHSEVASSHASIGEIEVARGRYDEAIRQFEQARDIWTAAVGPEHRSTALALHHLGATLHMAGRSREGIEPLERSLTIRERTDGDPGEVAESKFDLAQALWAAGQNRDRARELATQARAEFDPKTAAGYVEATDRWLAAHAPNQ
jgi:tetratricopeptide (TPR) repeat protein